MRLTGPTISAIFPYGVVWRVSSIAELNLSSRRSGGEERRSIVHTWHQYTLTMDPQSLI